MAHGSSAQCGTATTEHGSSVFRITTAEVHGYEYEKGEGKPLNWDTIIEIVLKYWIQEVCVLAVAIITWLYRRQIKQIKKEAEDERAIR